MHWIKIAEKIFHVTLNGYNYLIISHPFTVYHLPKCIDSSAVQHLASTIDVPEESSYTGFYAVDLISTTYCNFSCTYCFASSKNVKGLYGLPPMHMDISTMQAATDFAFSKIREECIRKSIKFPRVDFFITGGEPLLNFYNVSKALDYIAKCLSVIEYDLNINVSSSIEIATNASLITPSVAHKMKLHNVQAAVTIDGPSHNKRRPFSDGSGSLEAVLNGINELLSHDVQIKLQTIVPMGNIEYIEDFFHYYDSLEISKYIKRVHVIPEAQPIMDMYCKCFQNSKKMSQIYNDFGKNLGQLSAKRNLDLKNYQGRLNTSIELGGLSHRCPAGQWKIAVTPDGSVFPCHQLVNIPEFFMGNIDSYFYKTTECIKINKLFEMRTVFNIEPCSECLFQAICIPFVDCPARCYLENKSIFKVTKEYCKVHLPNMERALSAFLVNSTTETT